MKFMFSAISAKKNISFFINTEKNPTIHIETENTQGKREMSNKNKLEVSQYLISNYPTIQ